MKKWIYINDQIAKVISAETITEADEKFQEDTGLDPKKHGIQCIPQVQINREAFEKIGA